MIDVMRKLLLILLALLLSASVMTLAGCNNATAHVESTMSINRDFAGSRVVNILYPASAPIDAVKDELLADTPAEDIAGAEFRYCGVEEGGYRFEMTLSFDDRASYIDIVSAFIGREPTVFLSMKDTVLTEGVRMVEDFGSSDLIGWMTRITEPEGIAYDYSQNAVNIGSEVFNTDERTDIDARKGSAISSITIETSNSKNELYDRTVSILVPNTTYDNNRSEVELYFAKHTADDAVYAGWSAKGEAHEYTVIFQGIGLQVMREHTAMLLDTDNETLFYGDRDNASTPLSEGLQFEESFDTFSYLGTDGGAVPLTYTYALPTLTTYGEGALLTDGSWQSVGGWSEGVYTAALDTDAVSIRIPDGIQYAITGIDFSLTSLLDGRFSRTVTFLYDPGDTDALNYAASYFAARGGNTVTEVRDDALMLSVTVEGTVGEINDSNVGLFGSRNFMSYEQRTPVFALSTKTELRDYIDLSAMLNSSNATVPMRYTVSSSGRENITELYSDSSGSVYAKGADDMLTVAVENGVATVVYRGDIPILSRIILYSAVGGVLLIAAVLLSIYFFRLGQRKNREELRLLASGLPDEPVSASLTEGGEEIATSSPPSLEQTTTFSILELGALARNKKYVDEINKDIEERLELDRLEERKKALQQQQLEEMEKKVYGTPDDTAGAVSADAPDDSASGAER